MGFKGIKNRAFAAVLLHGELAGNGQLIVFREGWAGPCKSPIVYLKLILKVFKDILKGQNMPHPRDKVKSWSVPLFLRVQDLQWDVTFSNCPTQQWCHTPVFKPAAQSSAFYFTQHALLFSWFSSSPTPSYAELNGLAEEKHKSL